MSGAADRANEAGGPVNAAGGPANAAMVRLSKRLSRVLRHAPGSIGLTLDPRGWVPVDELLAALAAHGPPVSRAQLDAVVAGNDKQRFAVLTGRDGVARIRASQGHSVGVPVDLDLPELAPPAELFHGTPAGNLPSIMADGLRPGRRHHVHLSADPATARTVGLRRGTEVAVLVVAAAEMARAGQVFQRSANGVWLTGHVAARYLSRSDAPGR